MKQKIKTHRGAAKRFKITGTGKVTRHHAFARHILTSKAANRKRRLGKSAVVSDADTPAVKKMLPYA
jgi:large subunit ribosomal protein L35